MVDVNTMRGNSIHASLPEDAIPRQASHALPDPVDSETMRNTLSNFEAFKRTREEAPDSYRSTKPPRAAKRRCSFSIVTHVRVIAEEEEEEPAPPQEEELSPTCSCPNFLFASWGDKVECGGAPAPEPITGLWEATQLGGNTTPSIADFALETKQADGPEQVSLFVTNLIEDAVSATNKQLQVLKSHLNSCDSHLDLSAEKLANVAPKLSVSKLKPAMIEAVYMHIQKLVIRVREAGSVGLLPQAMRINKSHLPVLEYLLLKLHRAALADLYRRDFLHHVGRPVLSRNFQQVGRR